MATGTIYSYNAYGTLVNQKPYSASPSKLDFTTNEVKTKNMGAGAAVDDMTCSSIGNLEKTLLEMAKR